MKKGLALFLSLTVLFGCACSKPDASETSSKIELDYPDQL